MQDELTVYRTEKKYYISWEESLKIQEEMQKLLIPDKFSKDGSYVVRSLYFDSINQIDYIEKDAGTKIRKKIRLRIYDPQDQKVKLELKEKDGEYQHKSSLVIERETAQKMQQGDYSPLLDYNNPLALRFYTLLTLGAYQPEVLIEYDRRAFIYDEYNTRITIDSKVRSSEIDTNLFDANPEWRSILDDYVILEVKYDGKLFRPISKILQKYHLNNISFSKYGNGRILLEPYL